MGYFDFGRTVEKYPTRYLDQFTGTPIDVVITGIIISLITLAIPFYAILPAYSPSKRWSLLARITVAVVTGGIILGGNYGHNWEEGELNISTPYKPSSHEEIVGNIGLHISLRGINITLTGKPMVHHKKGNVHAEHDVNDTEESELAYETIDYNEHFTWVWAQGRFGFGPYAGQISQDFREATLRGVPLPILQTAEYFTFDGEGIRFGRYYRLAGWYTHQIMWAALGTWFISTLLSFMIVNRACYFLVLTGLLQLSAIGVWTFSRNPIEIQIPFQSADGHKDVLLTTHFGLDYYLVLTNSLFCILLGIALIVIDGFYPEEMCHFFGIDPLTIYDEFHTSGKEEETEIEMRIEGGATPPEQDVNEMEMGEMHTQSPPVRTKLVSFFGEEAADLEGTVVLKRRESLASKLFQGKKSRGSVRRVLVKQESQNEGSGHQRLPSITEDFPPPPHLEDEEAQL